MTVETSRAYPSRTIVIPDDVTTPYTDLYLIFYDLNSGDMFDATTGAVSSTWADCAVAGAAHASNTGVFIATTPPIAEDMNIGINIYDAASPADTDPVLKSAKYDPKRNLTYSDATPAAQGKTFMR